MTFRHRLREALEKLAKTAKGHNKYGNNGYVLLSGKKYFVGKMSFDEYYIEPYRRGKSEKDAFHEKTLWETTDTIEVVELLENNGWMKD